MHSRRERVMSSAGLLMLSLAAVGVGRLSATRPSSALALAVVPLLVVSALAPTWPLVASVALLPFQSDNFDTTIAGLRVGPSDALFLLGLGGVVLGMLGGEDHRLRRLGPVMPYVAAYFALLLVAWVNLPSVQGVATIVQRFELVAAAIVVGGFLAAMGKLQLVLTSYVLAATLLAAVAVVAGLVNGGIAEELLGVQKNPAGQAIANALLIVMFNRKTPFRAPVAAVLVLGLVAAQSRGALLATVVALALAVVLSSSSRRLRAIAVIPIVVGVAYAAFSALPSSSRDRLVTTDASGDVANQIRQSYADDAVVKIKSAPILGTGVGLYVAGEAIDQTLTLDPHNVVLLEAAEGGVVLLTGFTLLTLGSAWVLIRRRHKHPVVLVALTVQVSIILHGTVDVYWVRGTPVLGWILVGAALWLAADDGDGDEAGPQAQAARVPRSHRPYPPGPTPELTA
ncbi:O-antigen ligase family protein [Nocardioides litoris]|uniref:O-antigen ligase family protein n=1 Tax=Nocardioides litoris TaxID=1926648 RepID=UPI00111FCD29|nr:O-antigen ligase family protein [Nocardioides litoris]